MSGRLRGHCRSGATQGETIWTEPELQPCSPTLPLTSCLSLACLCSLSLCFLFCRIRNFYFLHRVFMKIRQTYDGVWHIVRVNVCFKAQSCPSPDLWLQARSLASVSGSCNTLWLQGVRLPGLTSNSLACPGCSRHLWPLNCPTAKKNVWVLCLLNLQPVGSSWALPLSFCSQ